MSTWEETVLIRIAKVMKKATKADIIMAKVVEEVEAMTGTTTKEEEVAEEEKVADEMVMKAKRP